MNTIIAYTDGGAKGNPGPAAVGVYIIDSAGAVLAEVKEAIGNSTSDFAEYYAVMLALQTLEQKCGEDTKTTQFEILLDSELVKKQLNSEQQVEHPGLVPMFIEIHNLRVRAFPYLTFTLIESDQNQEANSLVNEALAGR